MDFGLGLILSFTDNATSGINNAVNSLGQLTQVADSASASLDKMASLSAFSVVSDRLGGAFLSAGTGILGLFSSLIGKVQSTGSEFESFRVTLNALYGDAETADNAIRKLLDFSVESPFEVDQVKDMLIVLQSQGVNAFEEITGGISGARQETLTWIADLMAFKPDEATSRWKRALTNYIGSGEERMLRNILDMGDIDQLLGHDVGATVEDRLNDIVEIVESKNLTGLAQDLALTWQGVESNISDAFTKIYKAISDNGVFENLKASFMGVAGAILALDNDKLESLGATIAEGLNLIVTPITKAATKINGLITSLVNLCNTNPELVKWGMALVTIVGVLLVVVGLLLKVASAFSGVSLMIMASGKSLKTICGLIGTSLKSLAGHILPLIVVLGALAFAWKNDIGGIKTNVTKFVKGLIESFRTAKQAVGGSVEDLSTTLTNLRNKGDFFSNLTVGMMKVILLSQALSDAWSDNTLSEDLFLKAQELGILPLIESILDLKYRFGFFKDGFIAGWNEIVESIKASFEGFASKVKGTFLESILNNLTSFFEKLASGDTEAWYEFGESFAYFIANALVFYSVLKSIVGLVKIVTPIVKFIKGLGLYDAIGRLIVKLAELPETIKGLKIVGLFTKISTVFKNVISGGMTLKESLTAVFGAVQTTVAGVTSLITGIVFAVVGFVKQLKDGFSWFWEIVKWIGLILAGVGAVLLEICGGWVATLVVVIVGLLTTLIVLIKDHWTEVCTFFRNLGNSIATFFTNLWNDIVAGVQRFVEGTKEFFSTIGSWINNNVIIPVRDFFTNLWSDIVTGVSNAITGIKNFFSTVAEWIDSNVIQPTVTFFVNLWTSIVNGVQTAIDTVKTVLITIASWIYNNVIAPVVNFFMTYIFPIIAKVVEIVAKIIEIVVTLVRVGIQYLIQGVKNLIEGIKNTVISIIEWTNAHIIQPMILIAKALWLTIVTGVQNFIERAKEIIQVIVTWIGTNIVQPVVSFFTTMWGNIVAGVQAFITTVQFWFNTIVTWINMSVIQPIITFFTNLWNNIVTGVQNLISNIVTGITNFITGIQLIFNAIVYWLNANVIVPIAEFFTNLWDGIVEKFTTFIANIKEAFTAVKNWIRDNIVTPIAEFFSGLWEGIKTAFNVVADTISSVLKGAVNTVLQFICNVINGVIKGINWAIDVINAIPGVSIEKITLLQIPKLATGGVVDKPTTALIGEAGAEAVVPLENNLGWLSTLARMISYEMVSNLVPTNTSSSITNNQGDTNQRYLTNSNTNNTTYEGDTDNSIIFNEGAIQVTVQNASEEEALKFAKMVLMYIKRQKELDKMMCYA